MEGVHFGEQRKRGGEGRIVLEKILDNRFCCCKSNWLSIDPMSDLYYYLAKLQNFARSSAFLKGIFM